MLENPTAERRKATELTFLLPGRCDGRAYQVRKPLGVKFLQGPPQICSSGFFLQPLNEMESFKGGSRKEYPCDDIERPQRTGSIYYDGSYTSDAQVGSSTPR